MIAATEVDLQKKYSVEERDAMLSAYFAACGNDDEEADRLLDLIPINPRWAKIVADVAGKDFLLEHFNITYATEVLGEEWLDGK